MTISELQQKAKDFKPAIALENSFPLHERLRMARVLGIFVVVFLVGALAFSILSSSPELAAKLSISEKLFSALRFSEGLFYISLSFWFALWMLSACISSYACRELRLLLKEPFWKKESGLSYSAALLSFSLNSPDISADFFKHFLGNQILTRLGISQTAVDIFLEKERVKIPFSVVSITSRRAGEVRLSDVVSSIFSADTDASLFLSSANASAKAASGAAEWIERDFESLYRSLRWWGREQLGRLRGIGKDWAYGSAWRLSRYGKDISQSPLFVSQVGMEITLAAGASEQLESVLSRARETNALLVGEIGSPREAAVNLLALRIVNGTILPALEHKRVMIFDFEQFVADMKTKTAFETEFLKLFREVEEAGNIIVVFADFPSFIESATSLGSDAARLLDEYLAGVRIQIIAIAEIGAFHRVLETDAGLMKRFEKIAVPSVVEESVLPYAENEARRIERKDEMFFLYQSVETAVKTAGRYFMGESLIDKTADVLYESAARVMQDRRKIVMPADILAVVEKRTGVPVGELSESERAALINLENNLKKRVIGQDGALSAVASALRRARAGTANPNRPFGSFLFLGPTGVGKTETAKALAEAFFGGENVMRRLDLSEYQTSDALERLIGSFTKKIPGVLSSLLREKPYGVLLLDEFEKTTTDIKHLFLQVLDEGYFSDANGKRVNCRNLIILATSNAGSDLIWSAVKNGEPIGAEKNKIINALVERGTFTPELLNRFDGVILFEPLLGKNLRTVAKMMLQKLAARLMERGISFIPTERLVDAITEAGTDPQFGARAMQRAVTDKVERAIADKILQGSLRPGSRVELSPEEL